MENSIFFKVPALFELIPTYHITFTDGRQHKQSVVFCLHGKKISESFINYWSSFLFYLIYENTFIEPHLVNTQSNEFLDGKNLLIDGDIESIDMTHLSKYLWNYEYLFFLNIELEYFNPLWIISMIQKMNIEKEIDIMCAKRNIKNESKSEYNLDFAIIRKNILEKIEYPWFEKDNTNTFFEKIDKNKIHIQSEYETI